MSSYKSKNSIKPWIIVALIGLLGLNAYQWFSNNQLKKKFNDKQEQLVEVEKMQAELEQDYDAALDNLESLRGDNTELNELIDSQKKELKAQKDKINDLIWTKRQFTKAKEEIKILRAQAEKFIAETNLLREENEQLLASNTQLTSRNRQLSEQYEVERQVNEQLSEEREKLSAERKKLAETNEKMSVQVDMANAIKINYMDVTGFEVKDDGKLKKKSKAKDIDMLRTCIRTETNMVTPAGEKDFQIRIINPLGETVSDNMNSGVLNDKLNNTQIRYSTTGKVMYNNEDTEACIDWLLERKLPKGEYDIEIYNNGFPVGKGGFKLK